MGMTCYFVAVSDRDLPQFAAKPNLLLKFGSEIDISAEELEMFGLTEEDAEWEPSIKPRSLYVDKAWDGMNFLLNIAGGDADFPYTFITEGGSEFDGPDGDMGYGPPRAFIPEEVQEIARMLKDIDIDALYEQADPEELEEADVYCFSMDEPKEDSIGYFTHYLSELKKFVQEAASENMALIVYLA